MAITNRIIAWFCLINESNLSDLLNRAFNAMAVSVGTIEYVTLVYPLRCTVQQFEKGAEIEWRCEFCQHADADSTMEDVSLPDPPPEETSLEDSAVGPDLLPQQSPETTYHLVLEGTIRGKTKLVTNTSKRTLIIPLHRQHVQIVIFEQTS